MAPQIGILIKLSIVWYKNVNKTRAWADRTWQPLALKWITWGRDVRKWQLEHLLLFCYIFQPDLAWNYYYIFPLSPMISEVIFIWSVSGNLLFSFCSLFLVFLHGWSFVFVDDLINSGLKWPRKFLSTFFSLSLFGSIKSSMFSPLYYKSRY